MISDMLCSFFMLKDRHVLCSLPAWSCQSLSMFPEVRTSPYLRPSMGYGSHLDAITLLLGRKTEKKGKKDERKWSCTYVAMAKLNRNTPSTRLYSYQFILLQEQNCRNVWTSCSGTCCVHHKRCYRTPSHHLDLQVVRLRKPAHDPVMRRGASLAVARVWSEAQLQSSTMHETWIDKGQFRATHVSSTMQTPLPQSFWVCL